MIIDVISDNHFNFTSIRDYHEFEYNIKQPRDKKKFPSRSYVYLA